MRTKLWSSVGVLASIAAGMSAANAADLAVKAPVYKALPPVILSDWSGFYIGVHGGGGWGDVTLHNFFTDGTSTKAKPSGGLGGGHVGYNWQFTSVVAGVEGDFDGADIKGTEASGNVNVKTEWLASARARLGYVVLPNLLAYGTGGAAWGHTTMQPTAFGGGGPSDGIDQFGYAAGAGLEYKFLGNWIGRVEYLHYGFGTKTFPFYQVPTTEDIDVVRGGVSYKF
jgi:outer membrane immunogenic protein